MTNQNHTSADNLFNAANKECGGALTELTRYMHGDIVTVHVARWSHDPKGRLVVGENWHVA